MRRTLVKILVGFCELISSMLLDVIHQIHSKRRALKQCIAVFACHADLSAVVARHVDEVVACCNTVYIGNGRSCALGNLCCRTKGVRIEQEGGQ